MTVHRLTRTAASVDNLNRVAVPSFAPHAFLVHRLGPVSRLVVDVALTAAVLLLCLYAAAEQPLPPASGLQEPAWLTAVAAGVLAGPLVLRRRWPLVSSLVIGTAGGVAIGTGVVPDYASTGPVVAAGVALYALGLRTSGRRGTAGAVTATGLLLIGTVVADISADGPGPAGTAFAGLVCAASWAVGWTLRERRRHTALAATQNTARAVAEERMRIAREMHDIVGHSLALIAVKASVATHVAEQHPEEAGKALQVIETASRSALAELRRAVGAIRTEAAFAPSPTLEDLTSLAGQAGDAGVQVRLDIQGGDDAPEGVVVAAYRIVQESLTNVVKHAAPAVCWVHIRGTRRQLDVVVSNEMAWHGAVAVDGTGIIGMRERVAAYGGTFSAGPQDDDRFTVTATLPYES